MKQVLIPEIDESYTERSMSEELMELYMIKREFESLTKIDHPLICELLELFIDNNWIYFVSPFYTGGEVNDLLFDDNADSFVQIDYT